MTPARTDDEMDDLVEEWHNGAGEGQSLHGFLGMTWDEYAIWTTGMPPMAPDPRMTEGEA